MIYNFKEYTLVFDTPAKREQERAIANKIMDLLNKNKYDNLEEFISKNNNYQEFLKKNDMNNVIKHFGNTLNEEDFVRILENLRQLTKKKQTFETDNIKTTNIEDKEYNSFKGEDKTYFLENSISDLSIEEQMKNLQPTERDFQTTDAKVNTENMMKELEKNRKKSLNLSYLSEIETNSLNSEEVKLFQTAVNYQLSTNEAIKVDLQNGVIVDKDDNIMKIQKENEEYKIIKDEDGIDKEVTAEKTKSYQKKLTPSSNTIYSNAA